MSIFIINYLPVIFTYYWIYHHQAINLLYFIFIILPLMELLIPLPLYFLKSRPKKPIDHLLLYLWFPMEISMFFLFVFTQQLTFTNSVVMGLIMGLGINVAHELIHKPYPIPKWFGRRLLEFCGYGHWEWQHILYHHKNVGYPTDPATAPKGMSVYKFIPKCMKKTLKQAWDSDSERVVITLHRSLMINFTFFLFFGVQVAIFHLCSAFISIMFLETINYLEHYGLTRKENELVNEIHSWDAPYGWSSLILFKLPFHSDHHINAWKSYPELKVRENSPKYRFSYPVMFLITLVPPLFFWVTNNV